MMDKSWHEAMAPWIARVGDSEKLVTRAPDGFDIYPLYGQGTGPRAERSQTGPWRIIQRIDQATGERANAQALDDLGNGVSGLALAVRSDDLAATLKDVALHAIHIRIEGEKELALAFAAYVASRPLDPARLDANFCLNAGASMGALKAQGFTGPFVEADGRAPHAQGATEAQELAAVLHELAGALRAGLAPHEVSAALAANQDMFLTLAKFRALRLLWARMLEASGIAPASLCIHAETSRRMMAARDPHMNILRATAAVFGAGLGGADSICILPYSSAQGVPNAQARRLARNTQLIMLGEADLWRVSDAASGSGYMEQLTDALCGRAWSIFRDIEATGKHPDYDPGNPSSEPVIGVQIHQLTEELAPAIEACA
jgi:methylmalonyl-CoA mutase